MKLLEAGYNVCVLIRNSYLRLMDDQSLETFVGESTSLVKQVLEKYTDNMTYAHDSFITPI